MLGALADSLRGGRVHFETVVRAPKGREVRVALATSAALNAQGEAEGVLAIGQDLTAVRDLERRVVQAEKLSSLGKLAASVAHEINNPMTAVAAYVDSLLDRAQAGLPPPADEVQKLRKVRENGERILRFTQDLVSYARPASEHPQEMEIHPVLDLAVSFCSHDLEQRGVQLIREFGDVPPLLGVPAHLVQVFVNLITNACHALDQGGKLKLSTGVEEGRVVIQVEDNGTGIPSENLASIFEPFFTTKPAGKGSGLGLSIVQGIVEKHGGRVEVLSTPGVGTVFSVRLPLTSPLSSPVMA
jgi:signal transduction histidine kinase